MWRSEVANIVVEKKRAGQMEMTVRSRWLGKPSAKWGASLSAGPMDRGVGGGRSWVVGEGEQVRLRPITHQSQGQDPLKDTGCLNGKEGVGGGGGGPHLAPT